MFDGPFPRADERGSWFIACMAPIGEHVAQPRQARTPKGLHICDPIAVLDVGAWTRMKISKPAGIGRDMPLAATRRIDSRLHASLLFEVGLRAAPEAGMALSAPDGKRRQVRPFVLRNALLS